MNIILIGENYSIGVKYSLIVLRGGNFHHDCVLTSLSVEKYIFLIYNLIFRYLSWLWQYQTGKFVLLKQCYYSANMGSFFQKFRKWYFLPRPNTIRVNRWKLYFSITMCPLCENCRTWDLHQVLGESKLMSYF